MAVFSQELATSASAEAVWALWSDPARWSSWDPAVASVELRGPFASGTRGRVRSSSGPSTSFRLLNVEPGVAWTERTRLPLASVRAERRLIPRDGGLVVRHRLTFSGVLGGPWSRLLGGRLAAALPGTVRAVVRLAEAAPGQG